MWNQLKSFLCQGSENIPNANLGQQREELRMSLQKYVIENKQAGGQVEGWLVLHKRQHLHKLHI